MTYFLRERHSILVGNFHFFLEFVMHLPTFWLQLTSRELLIILLNICTLLKLVLALQFSTTNTTNFCEADYRNFSVMKVFAGVDKVG